MPIKLKIGTIQKFVDKCGLKILLGAAWPELRLTFCPGTRRNKLSGRQFPVPASLRQRIGGDIIFCISEWDPRKISDGFYAGIDRKSTRLNSSHQIISYAVFCLKKKKQIASRPDNSAGVLAGPSGRGRSPDSRADDPARHH